MAKKRVTAKKTLSPEMTTIEEAGRRLGISRGTAYQCAKLGQIPAIRLGHRLLVPVAALERMLRGETVTSEVKAGGR